MPPAPRILLSGVFGPFGVDDAFGRRENIVELFHNQVTKAQGIASFRHHHRSFGLYFLAENVDADVTVLDFPTRERFEREVAKGYDIVGISFIAPNFVKAREMAAITRRVAPGATLVLGGHGAAIEGIEALIECDHVVKGEGIRWLRSFLGQDPNAPIRHPALPSSERESIFGVPVPGPHANLLVPGVGCVNGCSFCSTSHFFGKAYTPFLSTGQEIFETACRLADERGVEEFFVMDENFLKDTARARDLLALVEQSARPFRFSIFSSAEAIAAFGVDSMVRLGVDFVWIGVEAGGTEGNFEKNKGLDAKALVRSLRDRGIVVLTSGILCQEHHTPETMQRDIDFMTDLQADFVQFMLLTPLPVTALYRSQKARGLLRDDLPWEEWHGQKELSYRHPAFPGDAPRRWIDAAFRQDYERNGSSMLRVAETAFRGWCHLTTLPRDPLIAARLASFEERARVWACMLPTVAHHAVNPQERARALSLEAQVRQALPPTARERAFRLGARALAARWDLRVRLFGDGIQPRTLVSHYPAGRAIAASTRERGGRTVEASQPVELAAARV